MLENLPVMDSMMDVSKLYHHCDGESCSFCVLENRRRDGEQYPPASLYQLCCGLLRHLCTSGQAETNIFEQAEFHKFCTTLDSEMKRLNSTGCYIHK